MYVGLVVGSMQKEHGLPQGWAPHSGETGQSMQHTLSGIENTTGLIVGGMHAEAGLPNGWKKADAPGPAPKHHEDSVGGALGF